ncbi:MAG: hypothetical protein JSV10_03965 [Candidatus Zixiibacteriota bacterium]|nr:MAG: hypothetical protein JSV10_03965 [candidate division Zixibacteria bacterium]
MKAVRLLSAVFILLSFTLTAQSEVPKLINYQGKLTTAQGGCVDTTVQMTFSIYRDSIGMEVLWTEARPSVQVKEGIFDVLLGSVDSIPCSVFTGGIRYLGVKVEDDLEMTPRKTIVSVGYAYRTSEADTAQYARTAPPDDDWQTDTSGFNIYRLTGNVGIGTVPQDSCKIFVQSDSMVGDYAIYARGGTGLKAIATAWEGTGIQGEGGHAGVEGNGYIGILGQGFWGGWFNGMGYFSGNVGIGTTEPDEHLEVDGNAHITGDLTVDGSINSVRLKVYDSGWFAVSQAQTYTLTHNLGTTKVITELWFSTSSDGSNAVRVSTIERSADAGAGGSLHDLTATNISVSTGRDATAAKYSGGWLYYYGSGYYRLILLALE